MTEKVFKHLNFVSILINKTKIEYRCFTQDRFYSPVKLPLKFSTVLRAIKTAQGKLSLMENTFGGRKLIKRNEFNFILFSYSCGNYKTKDKKEKFGFFGRSIFSKNKRKKKNRVFF